MGSGTRALAIYEERWQSAPTGPLCIYLHGVRDPGNIGTVLRSAQAFGASSVTLGPGCTKGAQGTTIPLRAGKPDVAGLASCTSRLKSMAPAWAHSTIAEVTASPELDMQTVLEAVSVIVRDFPVIHFGMLST